ncbi:biotin--[acetyl-CoA-carboxylase] ligase [Thermoflavifilum thermophilum]|uniref:BirA family transcriptional regulator, biotin operon repressor / biotin-[acetyl-CoA-carboxylase] ligase n=1 Tax=Thermoflavifilum thermophilum TaxID=1393122 RepID=A0A1I7NBU9_9BACT|nr:biotin--[acetyl-CoA-carboxylase] ligase [Thermoflavifilum thermophilum]SFV32147.1 BirA family transcriptional regulator, biotin operon repressor / biotin-[acetyl-CoA-carboxylase] ligase [Thermoflavifilum thermophilum]
MEFVLIRLDEVDSTNNYAMARIQHGGLPEGTVIQALQQHAGRGQRNKGWISEPRANLLVSIILKPAVISHQPPFLLSMAVAAGLREAVARICQQDFYIKWTNDLYWNDRKAGGILIENTWKGQYWQYAVVGIGLNVNQKQFPPELPNPVSLTQITGKEYELQDVLQEVYDQIMKRYRDLQGGKTQELVQEYHQWLYRKDREAWYESDGQRFRGIIREVQPDGHLIMDTAEGRKSWAFGQLEFVLDQPATPLS